MDVSFTYVLPVYFLRCEVLHIMDGKSIKRSRELTVHLIKPLFIPLNNQEILIVFKELFHESLRSGALKATVYNASSAELGRSSSAREPEVLNAFAVKIELSPCKTHQNLTIKFTYEDTTGEFKDVTEGPFSYIPKPSICENNKLVKSATLEDALASLKEEDGRISFVVTLDIKSGNLVQTILIGGGSGLLLVIATAVTIFIVKKKLKVHRANNIVKPEDNDEYGMYYSATGERLNIQVEVRDRNPEYEPAAEPEEEPQDYDDMDEIEVVETIAEVHVYENPE